MGAGFLDLPRIAPCQHRRPGRTASGRWCPAVNEKNPLPGDAIERRSVHELRPIGGGMGKRLIVADHDEDVGPLLLGV